jgi:CheY-like chemotaxis protein
VTPEISTERTPRRGAILVVEDRDDVRQGMAQLLELHGFLVVDAAEGAQALAHLHTDPKGFALMLLDLRMPGAMNGSDVRRTQLTFPELADIPTVVVSASEPEGGIVAQLHADAWIEKPFRFDDLLEVVRRYVTPNG